MVATAIAAPLCLAYALLPAVRPLGAPRLASPRAASPRLQFGRGAAGPTGPSEEAQSLYRMLGIAEDADYDQINAAYDDLCAKYEGQTKQLIKLQVAKDKILEDRLRLRMSGALKAAVAESPWDRPPEKKPLISIPPFAQGFMELPDTEYALTNAAVFGVISLLPIFSTAWASTSVGMGFALGMYKLYNRGAPDTGNNMDAAMRPPKARPLVLAAGITFLAGAIGATLSQLLYASLRFMAQELVIALCTSFAFFTSSTLFKVQDA